MVRASIYGSSALAGYGRGGSLNGPLGAGAGAWASAIGGTSTTAAQQADPAMRRRRDKDMGLSEHGEADIIPLFLSDSSLSSRHQMSARVWRAITCSSSVAKAQSDTGLFSRLRRGPPAALAD